MAPRKSASVERDRSLEEMEQVRPAVHHSHHAGLAYAEAREFADGPVRLGGARTRIEQPDEGLLRHWRSKQHALGVRAAHHLQSAQVGHALDAFRYRGAAEAVGEVDGGLADGAVGAFGG